jgi:hypothetical protein
VPRRDLIGLLVLAAALAAAATASATPTASRLHVYFLQGEQLRAVTRPGTTAADAVRQLLAGPTPAEVRSDFRTYVPTGTRVRSVTVSGGVATVDLSERFVARGTDESLLARLAQLVRTLTGPQGATKVQLLLNGAVVPARFPGIPTGGPITFAYLQKPNVPLPHPPALKLLPPEDSVKLVQQSLISLGYLLPGDDDGRFGPATQNAILAFQKWERLGRTGLLDAQTKARLATAAHPTPITQGAAGKRAEVLIDRQVALLIDDNEVVRTIAVSTGKPSTPTPPGSYRVYAKIQRWWSTPFREWLPWAVPFVGGIAFHELADVPAFPASHGCVRQSYTVAHWTYDFAAVGMPVRVLAKS